MNLLEDKFLIQESNSIIGVNDHKVVSKIKPNDEILEDIFFTWKWEKTKFYPRSF